MGLFVLFLLPETKSVPIDVMVERVWKRHPVWKKLMGDDDDDDDESKPRNRNMEMI